MPDFDYLLNSAIHGPVIVEHNVTVGGGESRSWSEVVDLGRNEDNGGRQICHCANREDAEMIAAMINKALTDER